MITFVKSSYKCKKPLKPIGPPRRLPRPSGWQHQTAEQIRRYLVANRHKPRATIYEYLRRTWCVEVQEKRFNQAGGVGSYIWMPQLRCYRIQVGASHMSKGRGFLYAPCVEIFDY